MRVAQACSQLPQSKQTDAVCPLQSQPQTLAHAQPLIWLAREQEQEQLRERELVSQRAWQQHSAKRAASNSRSHLFKTARHILTTSHRKMARSTHEPSSNKPLLVATAGFAALAGFEATGASSSICLLLRLTLLLLLLLDSSGFSAAAGGGEIESWLAAASAGGEDTRDATVMEAETDGRAAGEKQVGDERRKGRRRQFEVRKAQQDQRKLTKHYEFSRNRTAT